MTNNVVAYTIRNELLGHQRNGTNLKSTFLDFKFSGPRAGDETGGGGGPSRPSVAPSGRFKSQQFQSIFNTPCLTSKLPCILREREFDLTGSNLNKIFCSQWLDSRFAIMGSKCNKLVILDTDTGKYTIKDPVKSHPNSVQIPDHCGIHAIAINPSRTLLATGAENVNDIAIYSLPGMEPHSIGYNAHSYWIFDIVWLDDSHVVSGAGDNRLALWSVNTDGGVGFEASSPLNKYGASPGYRDRHEALTLNKNRHFDRSLMKRTHSSSPLASDSVWPSTSSSSTGSRAARFGRPLSSHSQSELTSYFNPFQQRQHQPDCPHFSDGQPRYFLRQYRRSISFSNPPSSPGYQQMTLTTDSNGSRFARYGASSSQQSAQPPPPSGPSRRLANHVVYGNQSNSVSLNPRLQYNPFTNTSISSQSQPSQSSPPHSSSTYQSALHGRSDSSSLLGMVYEVDYSEVLTDDEDEDDDGNVHGNDDQIEEEEEDELDDGADEDEDEEATESEEEDAEHRHRSFSEYVSFANRVIRAGPLDTSLPARCTSYNLRSKRPMPRSRTAIDLSGFSRSSPVDTTFSSQYYVDEAARNARDDYADFAEEDAADSDDTRNFCDLNPGGDDESEDEADETDEHTDGAVKRRRLNSRGKYKHSKTGIRYQKPAKLITCKQSKRIRALAFNPRRNEIAAISMNAAFHYFDVKRFEQKYTKKLSPLKENVCLAINDDYTIYAIGSASHVQLLDANNARPLTNPIFIKNDIGVRSVHFRNNILSIGTGIGTVLFYDLKTNHFLKYSDYGVDYVPQAPKHTSESASPSRHEDSSPANDLDQVKFQTNRGWLMRNETYYENLPYIYPDSSHAIYSHSYDPSGTKLLTAGGPLTVNLYGHYVAVWR